MFSIFPMHAKAAKDDADKRADLLKEQDERIEAAFLQRIAELPLSFTVMSALVSHGLSCVLVAAQTPHCCDKCSVVGYHVRILKPQARHVLPQRVTWIRMKLRGI